mmetsp:Transcript_21771/g.56775  ORF Transcript_21771/g.56775 Transcript_21771/m.56775 type:complete len:91 (-) Transcript_21771:448-720(-)
MFLPPPFPAYPCIHIAAYASTSSAAAAAAVKENGPNKESKPALAPTGQIPAGNEQKKPGAIVKTEIKKTAEDSEEFEDIPEEVFDYDSDV